jgi:ubiquinone biosynthesis monooxygenase Coq7
MSRRIGRHDRFIAMLDEALRTLVTAPRPRRPSPAAATDEAPLSAGDRRKSAALMRVNRAGELSAQALYSGQALVARSERTRRHLHEAADDERDHLAWCTARLAELGGRPSLLDPLWFGASLCAGAAAGLAGDRASLGFVSETERQVEAHLEDHLSRVPSSDRRSRAVLAQMAEDESRHGSMARLAGAAEIRGPVRSLMAVAGGTLRRVALVL